ncbi:MAG TPA: hypothetical protein VFV67_32140 [Actinophytocola sp.]|uniref:hypothetical protein n=1 Tax=Actinophytocola sp. TaxID=1872138 RepID=UPI002DBA6CD8|nr:hypothetical protein [Actinophytocola sp.]HEU5475317.1 hypothetical protein [Actinophytocola sp.]
MRPDDGMPAARRSVRCGVCDKELTFTVHSVAATRRRQARRRAVAWAGLALLLAGAIGLITGFAGDSTGLMVGAIVALVLGFVVMWTVGSIAAEEVVVTGHGNAVPASMSKHSITVAEPHPEDLPELVCGRCGHKEEFPWGSHFRKSFVQREYQAAKVRFEQYDCR